MVNPPEFKLTRSAAATTDGVPVLSSISLMHFVESRSVSHLVGFELSIDPVQSANREEELRAAPMDIDDADCTEVLATAFWLLRMIPAGVNPRPVTGVEFPVEVSWLNTPVAKLPPLIAI